MLNLSHWKFSHRNLAIRNIFYDIFPTCKPFRRGQTLYYPATARGKTFTTTLISISLGTPNVSPLPAWLANPCTLLERAQKICQRQRTNTLTDKSWRMEYLYALHWRLKPKKLELCYQGLKKEMLPFVYTWSQLFPLQSIDSGFSMCVCLIGRPVQFEAPHKEMSKPL